MKSHTDLEQSKKLAEILPIESADMTLPFRHTKDNKYLPGYVIARTYTEVYNEMIVLPGMEKQELCKLINPCWSLAALLNLIKPVNDNSYTLIGTLDGGAMISFEEVTNVMFQEEEIIDAAFEMIIWLKENGKL